MTLYHYRNRRTGQTITRDEPLGAVPPPWVRWTPAEFVGLSLEPTAERVEAPDLERVLDRRQAERAPAVSDSGRLVAGDAGTAVGATFAPPPPNGGSSGAPPSKLPESDEPAAPVRPRKAAKAAPRKAAKAAPRKAAK